MKPASEPFSLSSSTDTACFSPNGSVWQKSWNSRPTIRPWPRTSLISFGYFAFSSLQARQQVLALLGGVVDQALVVEDVERLDRGDAAFADAAERGRAMDQRGLRRAVGLHVDVAAGDHRRHRALAAAERLGQRRDVRHHAGMLEGVEAPGAAEAALHLVGDPQHAVLVAEARAAPARRPAARC